MKEDEEDEYSRLPYVLAWNNLPATVQSSDPVTNTPATVVPPTCTVPPVLLLWARQVTVPWW